MVVITEVNVDYGKTFGPFPAVGHIPSSHFIGLLTTDERNESTHITINPNNSNLGTTWLPYIHPARTQEEQNVEAYVKDRNIYYRMLRIIKAGEELLVWYSTDFAQQLGIQTVKRSPDTGETSWLTCTNCGEKFKYQFPLMAHAKFRCIKSFGKNTPFDSNALVSNNNYKMSLQSALGTSSELSEQKDPYSGLKRSSDSEMNNSPRKKLSLESPEENNNVTASEKVTSNTNAPDNDFEHKDVCSAFRKVEKSQDKDIVDNKLESAIPYNNKNNGQDKLNVSRDEVLKRQIYQRPVMPYGLHNSFNMLMSNWMVPQSSPGGQFYVDPRIYNDQTQAPVTTDKVEIINRLSSFNPDTNRTFQNNGILSKQLIMEQLRKTQYPYMQPANPMVGKLLSTATPERIQKPVGELCTAQNWCAKCNATFRMTSDLVYHMRSHHKREFDPMKRKREEKLQCNVCQETFKERHHLTRHMTSHS